MSIIGPPPNERPATTADLLLAVERMERKIDAVKAELDGTTDRLEVMQQWLTWTTRLVLGALMTALITGVVAILLRG